MTDFDLLSQAITILRGLDKTADIFSLLGKIQLKAKIYPGAADSFKQSIKLMVRRDVQQSHAVIIGFSISQLECIIPQAYIGFKYWII